MSINTATKIPAITQIKGLPPLAIMALNAIKETLEVREGLHEPLDRFVSVRELADIILNDEDIINHLGSGHSHDARYYTKTQWDLNAKGDLNVAQGAGIPGTLGVGDNNQLIRADSGAALGIEYFSLLGTANQLTVTHNADDTTLSLPQDIHSGASPTFVGLTLSGLTLGSVPFVKAGGLIGENNSAFFFQEDDSYGQLAVGDSAVMRNTFQAVREDNILTMDNMKALCTVRNKGTTNDNFAGFSIQTLDTGGNVHSGVRLIAQFASHALNAVSAHMIFETTHAGARSEKMRLSSDGILTLSNIAAGVADYDKFLVSDAGVIKFRTGAEVLSDIGGSASGHTHAVNDLSDVDAAAPNDDNVLTYKSGTGKWEPHPGGAGTTEYAFRTITGITADVVADAAHDTLTLASTDNKLSIVGTAASDTITFTVNQANLDHGSIGGLDDSADHTWALLVDGTRPLTANWNIGNFKLGINTVPSYPLHMVPTLTSTGDDNAIFNNVTVSPTGNNTGVVSGQKISLATAANAYTYNYLIGQYLDISHQGANAMAYERGLNSIVKHEGSGLISTMVGSYSSAQLCRSGDATDAIGINGLVECKAYSVSSNASFLDEDMADITDWTDGDVGNGESTQVTFDTKSCVKLDTNVAAASNHARRYRDIGTFGNHVVVEFSIYFDALGTFANVDYMKVDTIAATVRCDIAFASDGLYVNDGAGYQLIGINPVVQDVWQKWVFDIDFTTPASATVDIYLNDVLHAASVDCSNTGTFAVGRISLLKLGHTVNDRITYVDYIKVGNDLASGGGGTITDAVGIRSDIVHTSGTVTTGYLFRGDYSGTIGTKWGLYIDGETKNYFSGNVGIGVDPSYQLHQVATLTDLSGENYGTFQTVNLNPASNSTAGFCASRYSLEMAANASNYTGALLGFASRVFHYGTGSVSDARGLNSVVRNQSTGTLALATGAEVMVGAYIAAGTIAEARALNVVIVQNVGTITTGYLVRGTYFGAVGTKWGLYFTGETKNYFSGNVGIGADPSYPLHLSYSPGDVAGVGAFYDINPTGTHTAGRALRGMYLDIDSDANEDASYSTLKGFEVNINHTGNLSEVYGSYTRIQHDNANVTAKMYGMNNEAYFYNGSVLSAYGCLNKLYYSSSDGTSGYGLYNSVQMAATGKTLASAYGNYTQVQQTAGTLTEAYLYYGGYSGTIGTKWGLYLSGETKNYFSGRVGIGVDPTYQFHQVQTLTDTSGANYGAFHLTNLNPASNSTAVLAGARHSLETAANAITYGTLMGLAPRVFHYGSGAVADMRGLNCVAKNSGAGTTAAAIGANYEVNMGAAGTITLAFGTKVGIVQTAGTITTGYLFFGAYSGTIGTKWGVYLDGETKNYFSGSVGIGVAPPANALLAINTPTEDTEVIDAGSAGATEQDWIQVEIGGVTGYIRVFATK